MLAMGQVFYEEPVMNALSKAIMADALSVEMGLTKPDAKAMVEQFFEEIRFALEEGQHVKLSGFGNFTLRDKLQRPGRNPKTGEEIPVAARRVVTFKPGLKLKIKIESRDQ
jgi:integration host factor subunit alpha